MRPREFLQWLCGFGGSRRAARPRSPGSAAAPAHRQVYLRRARVEHLEDRTLLSIVFVDDTAPGPLYDGTSWATAFVDLKPVLDSAVAGTEIRVAQGTYKPTTGTDRMISFALRNNVALHGGYAGYGAADPDARDVALYPSILSGDIGTVGNTLDNSYHVLGSYDTNSTAVLDGCTITAGNADESSSNVSGGGMYCYSSSPTLANCTFTANSAGFGGGGMYNEHSSPTLTNCTFTGNSASSGGGMDNSKSSSPTLVNCTFTANSAGFGGGGMYNNSSSPTLVNCTFTANSATGWYCAGGVSNSSSSSPKLTNCILWGNAAPNGEQIDNSSSTPVVTYCDVQGGYAGTGNINLDPQFVRNPSAGPDGTWGTADDWTDLRLRLTSPCIDAGKNSAVSSGITTDLAGNLRFDEIPASTDTGSGTAPIVDIGAYEVMAAVQVLAGGPYGVLEGANIVLSGAGYSPQPNGQPLIYTWDFNGDGIFDDATGPSPAFSAVGIQTPQTLTIALRVTDALGGSATETTLLRVLRPVYVDDSAEGRNDGTSWTDAYTSLQSALAAAKEGQVIRVGQGTYKPTAGTDRTVSFRLGSSVSICGGYRGCGPGDDSPDARDYADHASILSGDIGIAGSTADNNYHVVTASGADSTALLDGVTVTGGNANGSWPNACGGGIYNTLMSFSVVTNCTFAGNFASNDGGGMYNTCSSPTLANCTFTANSASYGGGMWNCSSPSPTLTNCTFTSNSATGSYGFGGGMYNDHCSPTLTNCTFTANSASYGGGMWNYKSSSPTLTNCSFSENSGSSGGGMDNSDSSSPTLVNCTFTANSASDGGAMSNSSSSSPTLTNCTFTANSASAGGGMYNYNSSSPTLTNCTFAANSASNDGGGMHNWSSSPTLSNCTFTENSATGTYGDGGGMYNNHCSPTLTNCTFTANSGTSSYSDGGGMYNYYASATLTNCTFTANSAGYDGGGMLNWSSSPRLTNCTFTANSAGSGGGIYNLSGSPTMSNCILWVNTAPSGSQIYSLGGALVVTYCDVQGGYIGTTNKNVDPQFVRNPSPGADGTWGTADDDYGDLRLLPGSPCIDAGKKSAVPLGITTDLAGNPRFVDVPAIPDTGSGTPPIVDMGAYESPNPNVVVAGAAGEGDFLLGLTTDGASVRVGSAAAPNTYWIGAVTSVAVAGGSSGDRLAVDFANGNPVPSGGVTFDGGAEQEPGDSLVVKNFAGATGVTVTGEEVLLAGLATIGYARAVVVLDGQNDCTGAMTVEGGTVRVDDADALPTGTVLAIHAGNVVLRSGLGRAIELAGLEIALAGVPAPACGAGGQTAIGAAETAAPQDRAAGTAAPQDRGAGTAEVGTVVSSAPSLLRAIQSLMMKSAAVCAEMTSCSRGGVPSPPAPLPQAGEGSRMARVHDAVLRRSPSAQQAAETAEGDLARQFVRRRTASKKDAAASRALDAVLEQAYCHAWGT